MNPTLVANAYLVITFLSMSFGPLEEVISLSIDILLVLITLVGVEGAD